MSEYLHECFITDPDNGLLFWKERPIHHFASEGAMKLINTRCAGKEAGCMGSDGYLRVRFKGRSHLLHRIMWELINGRIPNEMQVDHINHNRSDNRICNLRLATKKENLKNKSRSKLNTTGESGISYRQDVNKFMARVSINGHRHSIGCFETVEQARVARSKVLAEHGFHSNHGRNADEL